jgi:acyl-CoA thioesterase-2
VDFDTMIALEPHGPDTFVGRGPRYPWGGLYGGQIVAQGLRAAAATVDPGYRVHSLHAYFIRRGDHDEPVRFEVDRLRNGRSFVTRRVVARQAVGAILNLDASFQVDESGPEVETARAPDVPHPDQLEPTRWTPMFERVVVPSRTPGRVQTWLRMSRPLGEDPLANACALAYLSDDVPTETVSTQHPDHSWEGGDDDPGWFAASLDHAIWFHRPVAADRWLLFDTTCHGYMSARGLAIAHVFTDDGMHVATVAQEVLLRHDPAARR